MMIPIPRAGVLEKVTGIEAAGALPDVEDVTISAHPGETLVPLPEGHRYLGFIFARARTPAAAEQALRAAHAALDFRDSLRRLALRGMRADDLTRIRFVSDPRISPDGRRVAFVVTTLSEEKDEYLSNIWLVDTEGGTPRRFTAGPGRDTAPRWSPDGSRLAFISERDRGKKGQLLVIPADGGEAHRADRPQERGERSGVVPGWDAAGLRLQDGRLARARGEEEKRKSKPARIITTLKYRFNGEGWIHDRRAHVFTVSAAGGAAPASAHRRRLGRRPARLVARRALDRVRLCAPCRPRPGRRLRYLDRAGHGR